MEQKDVLKALQRDHAAELKLAAERLKGTARHTEIIPSPVLSEMTGHEILLKPENLQVTGSFKIRGAYNKIASLTEEQIAHGIVTASAGNHAQGVAYAARERGAKATICMPQITPPLKVDATKAYGADVVLYGDVFDESKYTEEDLAELVRQAEEKDDAAEVADAKAREAEALEALNKALAEARLRGQAAVAPMVQDTTQAEPPKEPIEVKGQIAEDSKALDEEDKAQEVVKKVKVTSDYFNTLTQNEHEPKLIKAIIDEDVKATDGSRVRLRLLDDIEIGETMVKKGSYLYATMSGFGSQRVKGSINSIRP